MMEDYQIAGILAAFATVAVCFREFWQAFGGPDPRPRPAPDPVVSDWGEMADMPPFSPQAILSGSDDVFVSALSNQPDGDQIAPLRHRKADEVGPDDEELETLKRQARIRTQHEAKMARLRKAGLKLDIRE